MDTWQKCPVCSGQGYQFLALSTPTCHVCNGHGIISVISGFPPAGVKTIGTTGCTGPSGLQGGTLPTSNHTGNPTTNVTYRTDNPSTLTDGSKKS